MKGWLAVLVVVASSCLVVNTPCPASCREQCVHGVCVTGGGGALGGGMSGASGGGLSLGGGDATGGGLAATGGGEGSGGGSSACASNLTACDGACVDTRIDRRHCGGCRTTCGANQACTYGVCRTNPTDCRQAACGDGFYCDLASGVCEPGCTASDQCPRGGECNTATRHCACPPTTNWCGAACTDEKSIETCGPSCLRCERAHATATCESDACKYACLRGFHACGDECAPDDSITQCGSSCLKCPQPPADATAECAESVTYTSTGGGTAIITHDCEYHCNPGFLKCGAGCCRATAVSAGGRHTCAITSVGGVKCWGGNSRGQLGTGGANDSPTPLDVVGLPGKAVAISAGFAHTCALLEGGALVCWGSNTYGELGDGTGLDRHSPSSVVGSESGVTSVSAGGWFTCDTSAGGTPRCWGEDDWGELGNGKLTSKNCTPPYCHPFDRPQVIVGLDAGVTTVQTGSSHACARLESGAVHCWGRNYFGEVGMPRSTSNYSSTPVMAMVSGAQSLAVGWANACVLTMGGGVQCWGFNGYGGLGNGTTDHSSTPVDVVGLSSGVLGLWGGSQGDVHCATTASGLSCWGYNGNGEIGDGTHVNRLVPTPVDAGFTVVQVSSGDEHTCALGSEGQIKCWGSNASMQLGTGTTQNSSTPVFPSGK